ncbi:MAG: hypothetical protein IJ568_04525 [Bacilli bacterium]|nr:hypothetical protein [Bacilli bacterium]
MKNTKKETKKTKKDRKELITIILAIIIIILGLSIAYSALSTTLNIKSNKISHASLTWDVAFETGYVNAIVSGTSSTGIKCGTASVTTSTVSVSDTVLYKPDDSCSYPLIIKNNGSLDAILSTITPITPTSVSCTTNGAEMVCGDITYKLTTDASGNNLLRTNSILEKISGTERVYLVIKYTGLGGNTTSTQYSGGFTLVYKQK